MSDSDPSDSINESAYSDDSDENEEPEPPKQSQFSRANQAKAKQSQAKQTKANKAKDEYKLDDEIESDEDFGVPNNRYAQPPMQKGYSESSDLFADPASSSGNRGIKRMSQEEDVFTSGGYKRFKQD